MGTHDRRGKDCVFAMARYVFIINPKAGKQNAVETVLPRIEAYFRSNPCPYTVHVTNAPGHATELARAEAAVGDPVRVIAVGGDGTLCEVANGLIARENAAVGILPCGSGNDYLKLFGTHDDFTDLDRLMHAEPHWVDMIHGRDISALNICCAELDDSVAMNMVRYKKLPLVTGTMAYDIALLRAFLGRLGNDMRIWVDDRLVAEGEFLLSVFANGRCYGGGYYASPESMIDDGQLDVILVRVPKSRLQIPPLLKLYKVGDHLHAPEFRDLLSVYHGRTISFQAKNPVAVTVDGECVMAQEMSFTVIPSAVQFLVPAGCSTTCLAAAQKEAVVAAQ